MLSAVSYTHLDVYKRQLYEDVGDSYIGAVFAAHSMELWLLEDMGFAVVAKMCIRDRPDTPQLHHPA